MIRDYEVEIIYSYIDSVSAETREEAIESARQRIRTDDITVSDFDLSIVGVYAK